MTDDKVELAPLPKKAKVLAIATVLIAAFEVEIGRVSQLWGPAVRTLQPPKHRRPRGA